MDKTENFRRAKVDEINSEIESNDEDLERKRLEDLYGKAYNTSELSKSFTVEGFMAPYITCIEKSTGKKGVMEFQHSPRFYFNFRPV